MEYAPLRPIPARPAGPVDPGAALQLVRVDSELEERSARAGAGGARRQAALEAAIRLELGEEELALELARARKELRRGWCALTGRGWCERAERLVSDRLDGPAGRDRSARLHVHLRNCPRCVEHERGGRSHGRAGGGAAGAGAGASGAHTTAPAPAAPEPAAPERTAPEPAAPSERARAGGARAGGARAGGARAGGTLLPRAAPAPIPSAQPARPRLPPSPRPLSSPEPGISTPRAAARGPSSPAHSPSRRAAAARPRAAGWYVLFAIAIILALAAIGLTIAGVLGAEL